MNARRVERFDGVDLYQGDALSVLPQLERIGAVITDPPYSSGGQFRSDRAQDPARKYVHGSSVDTARISFAGDNRDQRSFTLWATLWAGMLHQACIPGAVLMVFSDWRQVPALSDAIQGGGWVWRNLVTWHKPGIRMQRGRFSLSSEFVLYGSSGPPREGEGAPQSVLAHAPVPGKHKRHLSEKPAALISDLLRAVPAGASVCDPFMGAGTTGEACVLRGHPFVGIELDPRHFDMACRRLEAAVAGRIQAPPDRTLERRRLELAVAGQGALDLAEDAP